MKKFILSALILIVLLSVAGSALAIQITNPLSATNFSELLTNISTGVAGLVGTLSVIMIIIAGIMYLTSAGDPQKTNNAKSALKYAIIGIVLSLVAIPIILTIKSIIGAS